MIKETKGKEVVLVRRGAAAALPFACFCVASAFAYSPLIRLISASAWSS